MFLLRIFWLYAYLGVSKNRGTPKWMVNIMENPIKMDDLGAPLFLETPICLNFSQTDFFVTHTGTYFRKM